MLNRKWFAAVVLASVMTIAAPGVLAAAQIRIGLNGGRPSTWGIFAPLLAAQGLTPDGWLQFASHVGENWLPGTTPVALDYPGQLGIVSGPDALTTDQSTGVGQQLLHAAILAQLANGNGEPIVVAGLSEGTLVIDKELDYLRTAPDAPPAQDVTFYVFGDMRRGLGAMYLSGVTIPLLGQTFEPAPESQYDTVVVNEQWDGWANPPDRPWNLLADLNAVMGAVYTVNGSNDHGQTSLDSLSQAVKVAESTSSLGGTTTTYIVPRAQLALTKPLLQLGVPSPVVDVIDRLLMPLVQAGYSSLTPNLGPHIENGQFVWTPLSLLPGAVEAIKQADVTPAAASPAAASPAATSAPAAVPSTLRAAATAGGSSADGHDGPHVDAAAATGSVKDDPEPGVPDGPASAAVGGPTGAEVSAEVDEEKLADVTAARGSVKDDPKPDAGGGPAHAGGSAEVDQKVRHAVDAAAASDAAAAGGSAKTDSESGATPRTRPSRVHGPADSDGTADVPGQAKPSSASDAGSKDSDASPHAASAGAAA